MEDTFSSPQASTNDPSHALLHITACATHLQNPSHQGQLDSYIKRRQLHRMIQEKRNMRMYSVRKPPFRSRQGFSKGVPNFIRALLDTGAQKTVIGLRQAQAYCQEHNIPLRLSRSYARFKFASLISKSLGKMTIVIPTPSQFIQLSVEAVTDDIPLLIGIDILDLYSLQLLSVTNELQCVTGNWKITVVRFKGHIYLQWAPILTNMFTRQQLSRLHRHMLHPSVQILYNLLRRANPDEHPADSKATLKTIADNCDTCLRHSPKPI